VDVTAPNQRAFHDRWSPAVTLSRSLSRGLEQLDQVAGGVLGEVDAFAGGRLRVRTA